jgi:hypothetical protein
MSNLKKSALLVVVIAGLVVGGLTLAPAPAKALSVPSVAPLVTQSAIAAPWWGPHPHHPGWRRHHRHPHGYWRPGPRPYRWARPWRHHRCVWRPGFWRWGRWHPGRRVCW